MNDDADRSSDPLPAKASPAITSTGRIRAIPPAFKHIQANSCKTPGCLNFGVPPRAGPVQTGRGAAIDNYAIINTGSFTLACRLCGKSSTLKNNAAIHQEMIRHGFRRLRRRAFSQLAFENDAEEFVFRWNRRRHMKSSFDTLISIAIGLPHAGYRQFVNKTA